MQTTLSTLARALYMRTMQPIIQHCCQYLTILKAMMILSSWAFWSKRISLRQIKCSAESLRWGKWVGLVILLRVTLELRMSHHSLRHSGTKKRARHRAPRTSSQVKLKVTLCLRMLHKHIGQAKLPPLISSLCWSLMPTLFLSSTNLRS